MAQAAIPLIIGAGVLSAGTSYQQGQNSSRMATIAAGQLENNAQLAEQSAGQAKAVSQRQSQEQLRQNRLLQSRQIAIAAASGGSTAEKSVRDTIARTAAEGQLASDVALYEGDMRSMDYLNQAIGLRNKAKMTLFEGKQARQAGNIGAFSSLIGSAASATSFYGKYGNKAPGDTGTGLGTGSSIGQGGLSEIETA